VAILKINIFKQCINQSDKKREPRRPAVNFFGRPKNCCVCLVDIVESTKLISHIPESKTSNLHSIFLNTMAEIIMKNRGIIVKNMGDAVLFYFEDSIDACSVALKCGLRVIEKREEINSILQSDSLPSISYRVSADFGKVWIGYCNSSIVGDIFGSVVNMCAKINSIAKPNTMVIGNDLYLMAKQVHDFKFNEIKEISIGLKDKYPVFEVTLDSQDISVIKDVTSKSTACLK